MKAVLAENKSINEISNYNRSPVYLFNTIKLNEKILSILYARPGILLGV